MIDNINIEEVIEVPKEEWHHFEETGNYSGVRDVHLVSVFVKNRHERFVMKHGWTIKPNSEIPFIDIRVWYSDKNTGEWKPTKSGIRMHPSHWAVFNSILRSNQDTLGLYTNEDNGCNNVTGYYDAEVSDATSRESLNAKIMVSELKDLN
tara:strand:+ start:755 stop:1204 length:450 start_codon:yes stop_codon:yes gene_type:complete